MPEIQERDLMLDWRVTNDSAHVMYRFKKEEGASKGQIFPELSLPLNSRALELEIVGAQNICANQALTARAAQTKRDRIRYQELSRQTHQMMVLLRQMNEHLFPKI